MSKMENEISKKIKQEDKKHMGGFVFLMIICFIGGGVVGFLNSYIMDTITEGTDFYTMLGELWLSMAPTFRIVSIVLSVVGFVALFIMAQCRKKEFKKLDIYNDRAFEVYEKKLSKSMAFTEMFVILDYAVFAIASYCLDKTIDATPKPLFFAMLGLFMFSMIYYIYFTSVFVNLTKAIYPEKSGSVYDVKFHDKFMDSCDEAEKMMVYKCSYKAFKVMSIVYLVVIIALMLIGMLVEIGLIPILTVCLLWAISQGTYLSAAMKNDRIR